MSRKLRRKPVKILNRIFNRKSKAQALRALSRTRKQRVRALMARWRFFVRQFALQVKKGSVRAIAVLSVAVFLVIGLPALLIASGGKNSEAELPAGLSPNNQGIGDEALVLSIDAHSLNASASNGYAENLPTPEPTPEPHPSNTIFKKGMQAPIVAEIQERLMELGYMDWDEPTELYGTQTRLAVEYFQRKHDLAVDGCMGLETYTLLFSDQAKKYSVSIGDKGTDIKELQQRLYELGYLESRHPTDYFGTDTEKAVLLFQKRNGLVEDGTVGEMTREALYSEDAKANFFERGQVSEKLKTYQKKLISLGYLAGEADGVYGTSTEQAVRRFQERTGLIGDGYLGPQTISDLMSKSAQPNALMIGMKGKDVEDVQKRLKELNYLKSVDGYFGQDTEAAVRNFQSRNGLSVDGKIGKNTLSALISSKAKKAVSGGSSSSSGSSSSGSSSSGSSGSGSSGSSGSVNIPDGASVESFIAAAKTQLGVRYVRGGKSPEKGFDCSGFVYWTLNRVGVKQGYMTSAAWQKTARYRRISSMSSLKRGDVVSFKGHVGIYMGSGQMIDASSGEGKIRICSNIQSSSYWTKRFVCGYRIF